MPADHQGLPAEPELLTALFASAPVGIACLDAELRHRVANAAYARITGCGTQRLIGRRPDEVSPGVGAQLMPVLTKALTSGHPCEAYLTIDGGAGQQRHCVAVCTRLQSADGKAAVGVMLRDITERARVEIDRQAALSTEQLLRQEAERQRDFIRLVLENAPMGISVCEGPDYRLVLVNDFALRVVRAPREALIGRPLAETFPDGFEALRDVFERVYWKGETVNVPERRIPLPDGRQIWWYGCYAPLRAVDGSPLGVMSLGLDVTAMKQTQLLLQSQKHILEMIAMGAGLPAVFDAVVAGIAEHSVRRLLPAVLLVTGDGGHLRYAAAPTLPAGFTAATNNLPIGPNGASCGTAAFLAQRVTAEDVITDARWTAYRGAAEQQGLRACCSTPIVGSAGAVLGSLALYSSTPGAPTEEELRVADLMVRILALAIERQQGEDERARLLESERRARQQAERANRTKDEFVATLSHELRTPLNAILGWARMLRAGELDAAAAARALDAIERNTRAQSQLVEDLLDMSRIVTGKLRLDVRSVELSAVLDAAVDAFRPAAEAKNIRVQKILDPRAAPISGDPDRLQQVVWNLLSNAVKFTPKGGRVQVRLERINSHVEIIVSDTGQGIPPDLLPYVFDRFSQGVESGAKTGGLGLGLAIARHLVELHGGTIDAASDGPGAGATFTVKLPLMVARAVRAESEVHPTATREPVGEPLARLGRIRVLVVEDDDDGREIVTRIIEGAGAEVRAAQNAAEAYTLIREWRPDLLISDIEMPGEDGYTFIRRLREEPGCSARELPAVALTAYARVEDRIRALAAGFQMHVPKPVEPAELIAVIKAVAPNSAVAES